MAAKSMTSLFADGCPYWLITSDSPAGKLAFRWAYRYPTLEAAKDSAKALVNEEVFSMVIVAEDNLGFCES